MIVNVVPEKTLPCVVVAVELPHAASEEPASRAAATDLTHPADGPLALHLVTFMILLVSISTPRSFSS